MPTAAKTDIKEATKAEVQKKVYLVVKTFVEHHEEGLWAMGDEMQRLTQVLGYKRKEAESIFKEQFCKVYKIKWDGRSKNNHHESFTTIVVRVGLVGSLPAALYQEYRNSGKSLTSVWAKLTGDAGKLDRKITAMEIETDNSKKEVEAEKEEEVVDLFSGKFVSTSPPKKNGAKNEEETRGWVNPNHANGYDSNRNWIREGRLIAKSEPSVLVQFIETLLNKNLLDGALKKTLITLLSD